MKLIRFILFVITLGLLPQLCLAQWRTQTITLHPGWNAVHVEVAPSPDDCDALFANTAVESVWKWNRRFTSIQFVEDPRSLVPEDPDWLVWLPLDSDQAFLRRLRSLQAHQSYLIKLADTASPVALPIKGRVVAPRLDWYPHGLNLVGFPVNPKNPPTFTEFFQFTDEVDTSRGFENQLFRLNREGKGERVVQPARDKVHPGLAYWVGIDGKPAHMSVLRVNAPGGAIDFGDASFSQDLEVQNVHPTDSKGVLIQLNASEPPPSTGDHPELAGAVPLSYLEKDEEDNWGWIEFPAGGLNRTLAPGESWTLRLGLRRGDLPLYEPQGTNGATYQGIIEISDAAQSLLIPVPVSAATPESAPMLGLSSTSSDELANFESEAGLWVGSATLNQINAPAYTGDSLIPTPAPMSLRLIVHVDNNGQARLLQEVLLAWDPTLTDAPHTNGTYALFAGDQALPASASQVHRISSVGFPVMPPMALTSATNASGDGGLTGTLAIGFEDPTNPFLHRYHPMHDNKDWDFAAYTNAVEVPTLSREVGMFFTAVTNATAHPIWGVDVMAGTYSETITGLRAQPIHMQGTMALRRISRIDQLQGLTE